MSEKIRPQHLARKAILYVRQSSAYQVLHNLESQKLQYAISARVKIDRVTPRKRGVMRRSKSRPVPRHEPALVAHAKDATGK